jgi:hypothetical protein
MNTISIEGLKFDGIVNVSGVGQCAKFRVSENGGYIAIDTYDRLGVKRDTEDRKLYDVYTGKHVGQSTNYVIMIDVERFFT